tara:strand:- start:220 stop:1158 length:939 start_codon:yes stop_codon:yes gene_type:complete
MDIGIIGCSHSFGRGIRLSDTLFGFYDYLTEYLDQLDSGYPAILSQTYPQHNFEVWPVLGGGNKDIVNNLVNLINTRPKDMYIVQMTSWYRFTLGCLFYEKELKELTDNLSYNVYNTQSYWQQRGGPVEWPHLPNLSAVFKPSQDPINHIKGTGCGDFIWKNTDIPDRFIKQHEFTMFFLEVLVKEHFQSKLFIEDNWSTFLTLYELSKHHNIWYFYWNMPFGDLDDYDRVQTPIKDKTRNYAAMLHAKWSGMKHDKQIQPTPIHNYFMDTMGKKYIADIVEDHGLHLTNKGHLHVVKYLLENNQFMEALNG